jgi:gas vesicle protein
MKTGKVLLGVLAGVATGALLGILLAPDKGSNTRKKILSKGEDYAGDVKERFNGVLDTITDKYKSVKQDAEGLINNGRVKFDEVQKEIM